MATPSGKGKGKKPASEKDARVTTDPRFVHAHKDPRFIRPRRKDMKVKIDERFSQMLTAKNFSDAPKVDKYGRRLSSDHAAKELKRFYTIDDGSDDEKNDKVENSDDESKRVKAKTVEGQSDEETVDQQEEEESDDVPFYDRARGEGVISPSSSSESEDEDDELDQERQESMDEPDIPMGEETRRFAVVNLDWDNVKASDLMKLFTGFKSGSAIIHSVKVYPSTFGKARMEQETREGPPRQIFKTSNEFDEVSAKALIQEESADDIDEEMLRKYQLERLKYFYAVVECDTVETARYIYKACDGAELERTSNFFDLRFIPDDMTFNDEPRDECYQAPDRYKSVDFTTESLQHSRVKLTWDDDDPDRVKMTRRRFTKSDLEDMDFKTYLASSDEETDEDVEETRLKYKDLLGQPANGEGDIEQDMEITFTPGLGESIEVNTEQLDDTEEETEEKQNETTIETYLRKQREKRKARKAIKKAPDNTDEKSLESKKKSKKVQLPDMDSARQQAELELLVMDEDDGHKHFDMKEIVRNEKRRGKQKKSKKLREVEVEDDFEIDVADARFAPLHESHHFAIDPTHSHFKKTKAMTKLLEERRRRQSAVSERRDSEEKAKPKKQEKEESGGPFTDPQLLSLVNSLKRKSATTTVNRNARRKQLKS